MFGSSSTWDVRLGEKVGSWEARYGLVWTGLFIALVILLAAWLYTRPGVWPQALGKSYAQLSENPWDFSYNNRIRFRFLTPLISYLIGLTGRRIIITNHIITFIFLATTYWYARRHFADLAAPALLTAVLGTSMVTLSCVYYGGYCDILTYLIVLLIYWHLRRPWLVVLLLFLGVHNRESIIVMVPWVLYEQFQIRENRYWRLASMAVGLVLAGIGIMLIRDWIASQVATQFSPAYYFNPLKNDLFNWIKEATPFQWVGFFSVYKLLWLIPVLACVHWWHQRQWHRLMAIALLWGGVTAQLIVAFDTSRMLTLGFIVMLPCFAVLWKDNLYNVRAWLAPLILINLAVPQMYTAAKIIEHMHSVPEKLVEVFWFGIATW